LSGNQRLSIGPPKFAASKAGRYGVVTGAGFDPELDPVDAIAVMLPPAARIAATSTAVVLARLVMRRTYPGAMSPR
jgi:hypothetical protein